jgi:hypothetical protein
MPPKSLLSIALLMAGATCCYAAFFEVPGDFASIGEAVYYTGQGDTVLVHPRTYRERLVLPGNDFLLISEFYFTHDSSAIDCTIIDASDFAEADTASVLTFANGNSRATVVSGFTLRGGHGIRDQNGYTSGGAIYIESSHPTILSNVITGNQAELGVAITLRFSHARIAHNRILKNCGKWVVISIWSSYFAEEMAVVEWNDISENYGCYYPEWPYLAGHTIDVHRCGIAIRFNRFHDYCGNGELGVAFDWVWGELRGNSFERLSYVHFEGTQDWGDIVKVWQYAHNVSMCDNIFLDCTVESPAVNMDRRPLEAPLVFERNWFENVQNIGMAGSAALDMWAPNGSIRENVFIGCAGPAGAICLITTLGEPGCQATVEGNHFFGNRARETPELNTSAMISYGVGQSLCTVRDNWFEGNVGTAVGIDHYPDPRTWDCTGNYWGDPSGPYHPTLNPEGRGDTVGDHILFEPWLTAPPTGSSTPSSPFALSLQDWKLEGAYPNPFNESTRIQLISTRPQPFEMTVYNLLGQRVRQLWRGVVPKDAPVSVTWDGQDESGQAVATGIYFVVANSRISSQFKVCKVVCLR